MRVLFFVLGLSQASQNFINGKTERRVLFERRIFFVDADNSALIEQEDFMDDNPATPAMPDDQTTESAQTTTTALTTTTLPDDQPTVKTTTKPLTTTPILSETTRPAISMTTTSTQQETDSTLPTDDDGLSTTAKALIGVFVPLSVIGLGAAGYFAFTTFVKGPSVAPDLVRFNQLHSNFTCIGYFL